MKNNYLTLLIAIFSMQLSVAQISAPQGTSTNTSPIWNSGIKAPGDSCGVYYNNYVGLNKTSTVYFEALRAGGNPEFNTYGGRAQRFHAPQPIEVSGIQFYAFETNPLVDSLMAITILHDYTAVNDSVGVELARDTVYVTHQAYDPVLPNIAVNSSFPAVTVTNDYMITVITPTDDSLKIIVSDASANDGAGEGVSFLIYNNPDFMSAAGYYSGFGNFGAAYDLDYLINPRVDYDLHDEFTILDDSICPGVVSAGCVNYTQKPIYADEHYNSYAYGDPTAHILWLWGDGFQNTNLLTACHTYNNPGTYNIELNDTLRRHDVDQLYCVAEHSKPIVVIDDVVADFNFSTSGTIVDFTSTSSSADSLVWDMGDMTTYTDSLTLQHTYDSVGTFDVWLYAYNECGVDSTMMQVTTDDVGIEDYTFNFNVYPNPANQQVTINGVIPDSKVELLNILGKVIMTEIPNSNKTSFNLSDLSAGSYFVRVSTAEGQKTKKLIVR